MLSLLNPFIFVPKYSIPSINDLFKFTVSLTLTDTQANSKSGMRQNANHSVDDNQIKHTYYLNPVNNTTTQLKVDDVDLHETDNINDETRSENHSDSETILYAGGGILASSDMNAEFDGLCDEQKEIYALSFVVEDGGEKLSEFFRANGQPLTGVALGAVKKLLGGRAAVIFGEEYDMFDSENESVSFVASKIEALDSEFSKLVSSEKISLVSGKYIAENKEKFI